MNWLIVKQENGYLFVTALVIFKGNGEERVLYNIVPEGTPLDTLGGYYNQEYIEKMRGQKF